MSDILKLQRFKKVFSNLFLSKNLYDKFARENNNNFLFESQVGMPVFFLLLIY